MSKREDLIVELKKRIENSSGGYPLTVVEGSGGLEDLKNFPTVFLFEDREDTAYQKPGMYYKTLPIQIEFFQRLANVNDTYSEGKKILEAICTAIETDDRFNEICVQYSMIANQIIELRDGVVDVIVVYEFVYVDKFLGHDASRPFGKS